MKIIARVEGQPDQEYHFPGPDESEEEATNILIGRDDADCQAHWRLGKEDLTVSRAHFILEVRPPNCYIQDNMSTNGLILLRGGESPRRIQREDLQNGDRVRVGRDTILTFEILAAHRTEVWRLEDFTEDVQVKAQPASQPQAPVQEPASPPKPQEEPSPGKAQPEPAQPVTPPPSREETATAEWLCIRCGEKLAASPDLSKGSVHATDFMCANCKTQVKEERQREEKARAAERYLCSQCNRDVTKMAKNDGRAAELREVALYLCESCAKGALQKRSIGEWRTIKRLGKGGMGEVYQARHPATGRIAAVKMMLLEEVKSDETLRRRFLREISIMQELVHPHVVRLYEAGQDGNFPYFVSEFVPGGDFSQFIGKDGKLRLPPKEMALLFADSLIGLEHCHRKGFVHRDLKPENILLFPQNGKSQPKIADFGFARSYEKHGGTISRTGEFAGTWMYMPPEQIINFTRAQPTVDIYAMGVTLYYLLSGGSPLPDLPPPWQIMSGQAVRLSRTPPQMVLNDRRIPLEKRNPDLPRRLCQVVNKAIALKPEDRFQSAEEFRLALLESLQ